MSKLAYFVLCIGIAFSSGCAWQRVDAPPAYAAEGFPLTIALRPTDDPASTDLASLLAKEFKAINEFRDVIYPYREGDKVNCIMELNAVGKATGKGLGAGFVTGLTLGLAGTVMGPETSLIHDVDFYLTNNEKRTEHFNIHEESAAEFGVFANVQEVAQKQIALHIRKIAIAMSEQLKQHKRTVMDTCTGYVSSN
jgi:hypothetical protein